MKKIVTVSIPFKRESVSERLCSGKDSGRSVVDCFNSLQTGKRI